MKLGEMTLQEVIIIILFLGLLLLSVDHIMLRKDVGFGQKLDAFVSWQNQATNAINNIAARLPTAPIPAPIPPLAQPKPEGKK